MSEDNAAAVGAVILMMALIIVIVWVNYAIGKAQEDTTPAKVKDGGDPVLPPVIIPDPCIIKIEKVGVCDKWWGSKAAVIGIMAMALSLFFPPWHFWINTSSVRRSVPADRACIFSPPKPPHDSYNTGIDFSRLVIEQAIIILVSAAFILTKVRAGKVRR